MFTGNVVFAVCRKGDYMVEANNNKTIYAGGSYSCRLP